MDRNSAFLPVTCCKRVALRKESVDRNGEVADFSPVVDMSLSARRAWIEIECAASGC